MKKDDVSTASFKHLVPQSRGRKFQHHISKKANSFWKWTKKFLLSEKYGLQEQIYEEGLERGAQSECRSVVVDVFLSEKKVSESKK